MSYIVTGGCGFIGSNFVNYLLETTKDNIFVVDSLTYAGDKNNITKSERVKIVKRDITQSDCISHLIEFNNRLSFGYRLGSFLTHFGVILCNSGVFFL